MNSFFTFLFIISIFLPHYSMSMENNEQSFDQDFEQLMQLMQDQKVDKDLIKPSLRVKKNKKGKKQSSTPDLVNKYDPNNVFEEHRNLFPDWFVNTFDAQNNADINRMIMLVSFAQLALEKYHSNITEYHFPYLGKTYATYDYISGKIICTKEDIDSTLQRKADQEKKVKDRLRTRIRTNYYRNK